MLSILDALGLQAQPIQEQQRLICDDGLLSVSDAVFFTTLTNHGLDIEKYRDTPLIDRHRVLNEIGI